MIFEDFQENNSSNQMILVYEYRRLNYYNIFVFT